MTSLRAVLTYHSLDDSGSPISIEPASFAAHARWLASSSVRVVALEALVREVRGGDDAGDAVALTFDDGFANFGEHAAPLLAELGLPATVFVVSAHAGRTNAWGGTPDDGIPTLPLLDWHALGRLSECGIALGGHTRTHARLDALSGAALEDEIAGGAEDMVAQLGRRPTAFAYPYGATSHDATRCVGRHFEVGVTTQFLPLGAGDDAVLLPRLDAYYFRRPDGLRHWGSVRFRAYLRVRATARAARAASRRMRAGL